MHIQLGWKFWLLFKELFMTVWIHVKHWSQSPWNGVSQIKYYFPLPDGYFLLHIRLLPQHLQDFILQFFYSICFFFFLCWICLENELKALCDTQICAYNENSLYHTCVIADILWLTTAKMINWVQLFKSSSVPYFKI